MGKAIYEMKPRINMMVASDPQAATDEWVLQNDAVLDETTAKGYEVVKEEDTRKLFMLAKMMDDSEQFDYIEIEAVVAAMLRHMGYFNSIEDIADCITTWTERFSDYTPEEFQEWLID